MTDAERFCTDYLPDPHYLGQQTPCEFCGAFNFSRRCCSKGKVHVKRRPEHPELLRRLLTSEGPWAESFRENIIPYNTSHSMVSHSYDTVKTQNCRPYVKVNGEIRANLGPLETPPGKLPLFSQIFIYDPKQATEYRMRNPVTGPRLEKKIVSRLSRMLLETSFMAKQYKTMGELLDELEKEGAEIPNICLVLRAPTETELERVRYTSISSFCVFSAFE